jgi:hypothetical protein
MRESSTLRDFFPQRARTPSSPSASRLTTF